MEIDRYMEESFAEGMGAGGSAVKTAAEGVWKSARKEDEDDEAGFMGLLFTVGRYRIRNFVGTLLERR